MKKIIIITFLMLSSVTFFGQKKINLDSNYNSDSTYIKLKFYKNIFKEDLTNIDSARIKIIDGDTLVLITNFKKFKRKASRIKEISYQHPTRAYMPLREYKKKYDVAITKEDSLHFSFKEKDTLILISNKDFYKNQTGISVPYEPKDSLFLEIYKDVVYNRHNSFTNIPKGQKQYMRLWQKPINIYFAPTLKNYYKRKIKKAARKLTSIDSLKIFFVKNLKDSNYIIYQIDDENSEKYSAEIKNNRHVDYYMYWNQGRISSAKLELNLTDNGTFNKKENSNILLLNFYQTLGRFFTTTKLPCNSMFSKCKSTSKELTKLDFEIIKYHYSYGICKFTDLDTFEENHKKAKEILKNGGKMRFLHKY